MRVRGSRDSIPKVASAATFNVASGLTIDEGTLVKTSDGLSNVTGLYINFTKGGLGLPNNTGALILSHSITGQKNISVNSFGMVEKN